MKQENAVLVKRVECLCGHRLFDLISQELELFIKCSVCREVVHVFAKNGQIKTKREREAKTHKTKETRNLKEEYPETKLRNIPSNGAE